MKNGEKREMEPEVKAMEVTIHSDHDLPGIDELMREGFEDQNAQPHHG